MTELKNDPNLGTCYQRENCQGEMTAKGRVSKQKCKELKGKSWRHLTTGECEEI